MISEKEELVADNSLSNQSNCEILPNSQSNRKGSRNRVDSEHQARKDSGKRRNTDSDLSNG